MLFLIVDVHTVVAEIVSSFRSRPDLYAPTLVIEHSVKEKLGPGYIFVAPYEAQNPGPYIYDNEGNLVWSGWGSSGPGNAHGIHVCQYKGSDHLCFFQGMQQRGYCRGHGLILDDSYNIVRSVRSGGGISSSDMHEFRLINDGKTALMTVYQQSQFDMSPWNIKMGMGWVMESIFQEVDVETGQVLFEWRSLDHVDPSVSYTYPDHTDTSGDGLDSHSPWDYFHINSVDKNADGDYLVSSRHTCCIYKISGKNGTVLWRLNGANPSFRNINFSFSQQHDARWLSENSTHTVLSLYNNGYNGFNRTHEYSSGMVIVIDHQNKTAVQIKEYAPPGHDMISSSQGNVQMLPNKNVFMGWGNNAYVSEFDEDGNLLLWAYLSKDVVMNYRAQKFEWTGQPIDQPALWSYSRTPHNTSRTALYASWNGATKVARWKFYGAHTKTGPYSPLIEVYKSGFETFYWLSGYYPWTYAEAVDANGVSLGRSANKFAFVPSPDLYAYCDDYGCNNAPGYGYAGEEDARPVIPEAGINTVPWINPDHPEDSVQLPPASYEWDNYDKANQTSDWPVIVLIVGIACGVIGAVFLFRYYRRRRYQNLQEGEDDDDETIDAKVPVATTANIPWWRWRKWINDMHESHRYLPLTVRSLHGSDSTDTPAPGE